MYRSVYQKSHHIDFEFIVHSRVITSPRKVYVSPEKTNGTHPSESDNNEDTDIVVRLWMIGKKNGSPSSWVGVSSFVCLLDSFYKTEKM